MASYENISSANNSTNTNDNNNLKKNTEINQKNDSTKKSGEFIFYQGQKVYYKNEKNNVAEGNFEEMESKGTIKLKNDNNLYDLYDVVPYYENGAVVEFKLYETKEKYKIETGKISNFKINNGFNVNVGFGYYDVKDGNKTYKVDPYSITGEIKENDRKTELQQEKNLPPGSGSAVAAVKASSSSSSVKSAGPLVPSGKASTTTVAPGSGSSVAPGSGSSVAPGSGSSVAPGSGSAVAAVKASSSSSSVKSAGPLVPSGTTITFNVSPGSNYSGTIKRGSDEVNFKDLIINDDGTSDITKVTFTTTAAKTSGGSKKYYLKKTKRKRYLGKNGKSRRTTPFRI
jgi:hypothetical protein